MAWLLDCPGDSKVDIQQKPDLTSRGWEQLHYVGSFGKNVFNHRKRVEK